MRSCNIAVTLQLGFRSRDPVTLDSCQRIGQALDTQSERLQDECVAYDGAASEEEQRLASIRRVLSSIVNVRSNSSDGNAEIANGGEDAAIRW